LDGKLYNSLKKRALVLFGLLTAFLLILFFFSDYQDSYPLNLFSVFYLILFVGGFFLREVKKKFESYGYKSRTSPILSSISLMMIGVGFYLVNDNYDPRAPGLFVPLLDNFSLIIVYLTSGIAFTNLFFYIKNINKIGLDYLSKKILDLQKLIVGISVTFSYYFFHFRFALADEIASPIIYIDWIILILFAIIMVMVFLNKINKFIMAEGEIDYGKRHNKDITRYVDKNLRELENLQKRFVEKGEKADLLVYLIDVLNQNLEDIDQKRIAIILEPLIYHQDEFSKNMSFKWWKKRIKENNIKKRKMALIRTMKNISYEVKSDLFYEGKK